VQENTRSGPVKRNDENVGTLADASYLRGKSVPKLAGGGKRTQEMSKGYNEEKAGCKSGGALTGGLCGGGSRRARDTRLENGGSKGSSVVKSVKMCDMHGDRVSSKTGPKGGGKQLMCYGG